MLGRERRLTFTELAVHLPAEDVEQIRRRGHVGDLHVAVLVLTIQALLGGKDARVFVAELQVALHSARRVFRALAVVAVGQGQDETGPLEPLDLAGRNELVDNALRVVGKIPELSLPHHERIWRGKRVAVFEAKANRMLAKTKDGRLYIRSELA